MNNRFAIFTVLLLTAIMVSFTELWTITGKVTDISGLPLAGVTIVVKGNSAGTISDSNGNYKISTENTGGILVFSYPGYKTVEEKIRSRSVINVQMADEPRTLNEIVVQDYGTKKERASQSYENAAPSVAGVESKHAVHRHNYNFNTEGYAAVNENGYKNVRINPLSTFSIDVDNASYSNIRRFINSGEMPPAGAVRIEEMINYFKYDYPSVSGAHPFSVSTEVATCPWNNNHWLLQVGLKGKNIDRSSLPSSNLVFLIDVSGSMNQPNKLPLLKSGFRMLVNELRTNDNVAIVVYAGAAGLVLESTPGNRKDRILEAIENLHAGGSTAGGAGLKLAYSVAEENFINGGNNRIILATDGDFNVGESGNGAIERLVEEKRKKGVFITVLGFGMGNIKDDKMEIIADKGNGNYSYIDNLQEARKVLVREFGGTLFTIAKDVKFQIEFNPAKIESYRLVGYENRLLSEEDFNDDRKDAGEMGAGHNVTALYELVPAGSQHYIPPVDPLKYQTPRERNESESDDYDSYESYHDDNVMNELLTIKVRYKKPDGLKSMLMVRPVRGPVNSINRASENLRFASAVAEFGMILNNSEYLGNATLDTAAALARSARGEDEDGYRSEMIRLIGTVRDMHNLSDRE